MQPQWKTALSSFHAVENSQPQHAALITIESFSADTWGLSKAFFLDCTGRILCVTPVQSLQNVWVLCIQTVTGFLSRWVKGLAIIPEGGSREPSRKTSPEIICDHPHIWALLAFWRWVEIGGINVEEGTLAQEWLIKQTSVGGGTLRDEDHTGY